MVRLTVDLIARGTSGYTKKKRDESMQHYLKRLTHLYLEDRNIDEIGEDLSLCRHLIVLYLYDNRLCQVPNLNHNGQLTHLYLQNNNIGKLERLAGLTKLSKLYIGGNNITVVEGLEKLVNLQELHLENQKLPAGEKLLFDPRSIVSLASSLQVLNVSGNHLDSIKELQPLYQMSQFMASDNVLTDIKELAHCLSSWRLVWRLDLHGNPLCHKAKYRDRIIIMAPALEVLDGKEVTATAKQFLKNWQANKDLIKKRRESLTRENTARLDSSRSAGELSEQNYEAMMAGATQNGGTSAGYIMPALPRKQFQQVLARSASLPSSAQQADGSLRRTYSTDAGPSSKYLNTYGTPYHSVEGKGRSAPPGGPKHINLGADYAVGDGLAGHVQT